MNSKLFNSATLSSSFLVGLLIAAIASSVLPARAIQPSIVDLSSTQTLSTYPYSATFLLGSIDNDYLTAGVGSGCVVKNNRTLLTCGHNLYLYNSNWNAYFFADEIYAYRAWNESDEPSADQADAVLDTFFIMAGYQSAVDSYGSNSRDAFAKDFAVIRASSALYSTGAEIWVDGYSALKSDASKLITGYPNMSFPNQRSLYFMYETGSFNNKFYSVTGTSLGNYIHAYNVSAYPGNSGGPAWVKDSSGVWRYAGLVVARSDWLVIDLVGVVAVSDAEWALVDQIIASLPPDAPSSISYPSSSASGKYTVSWLSSTGATSYRVERSNNSGSTWAVAYTGVDTSFAESLPDGSYRYRVRASSAAGDGGWKTGTYDCVVSIDSSEGTEVSQRYDVAFDSQISSTDPNTNYGSATSLSTVNWAGIIYRSLVKFNSINLSASTTIASAKIKLYAYNSGTTSPKIAVAMIGESWTETGVTWNHAPVLVSPPNATSGTYSLSSSYQWISLDVTSFVRAWVDGSRSDNGLLIRDGATDMRVYWCSSEYPTTSSRPYLEVSFFESISTPTSVSGPNTGQTGNSLSFTASGASSDIGHTVRYQFDWGDGTTSSWGSSSQDHTYTAPGSYQICVRARCKDHTDARSAWSETLKTVNVTQSHTVNTPNTPSGPSSGYVGTGYEFSTGGSNCSQGHAVEYQFDWGDGLSGWGGSSAFKSYEMPNTYTVKTRARCAVNTSIVSGWSGTQSIIISPVEVVGTPTFNPDGGSHSGGSVNVTISCDTVGATIRYTSGSGTTPDADPTTASTQAPADGIVNVPVPGWLKAKAWKDGMTESSVKTAVWTSSQQPVLSVTPASRSVAKEAGTTTFDVANTGSGTMAWTASVTSGGAWARITSGASGSNAGTVTVGFDANPSGGAQRSATIRVTAAGATGSPVDVTVVQAANPASGGGVTVQGNSMWNRHVYFSWQNITHVYQQNRSNAVIDTWKVDDNGNGDPRDDENRILLNGQADGAFGITFGMDGIHAAESGWTAQAHPDVQGNGVVSFTRTTSAGTATVTYTLGSDSNALYGEMSFRADAGGSFYWGLSMISSVWVGTNPGEMSLYNQCYLDGQVLTARQTPVAQDWVEGEDYLQVDDVDRGVAAVLSSGKGWETAFELTSASKSVSLRSEVRMASEFGGWGFGRGALALCDLEAGEQVILRGIFHPTVVPTYPPTVFSEYWESGQIDTVRWKIWGSPAPTIVSGGNSIGSCALTSNGDANYESGVTSLQSFEVRPGLTVSAKMFVQAPGTDVWANRSWHGLELTSRVPSGWGDASSVEDAPIGPFIMIRGNTPTDTGLSISTPTGGQGYDAAPYLDKWTKVAFTFNADGSVTYRVNDTVLHTTSAGWIDYDNVPIVYLVCGGRSEGSGVVNLHDDITVCQADDRNVALKSNGGIASAGSVGTYMSVSHPAANANDGDVGTDWCNSMAVPDWLKIEFDQSYMIDRVGVAWGVGAHNQTFAISLSEDGGNWTTVVPARASATDAGDDGSGYHGNTAVSRETFPITPMSARYVKIEITATSAPATHIFQAIVHELQAYQSDQGGGSTASPVYRFWSNRYHGHFFTISEAEKDNIIANLSQDWSYEGVAYYASTATTTEMVPLYRFWSNRYRGHFFTISESEKDYIVANLSRDWSYEGIAYYVYRDASAGGTPVYRFWSNRYKHHFFTMDEAEKNNIIANLSADWSYEGISYYAFTSASTALLSAAPSSMSIATASRDASEMAVMSADQTGLASTKAVGEMDANVVSTTSEATLDADGVVFPMSYPGREVTASIYDGLSEEQTPILNGVVSPTRATFAGVQTGRSYRFEVWVDDPESGELILSHRSWFERQLDAPDLLGEGGNAPSSENDDGVGSPKARIKMPSVDGTMTVRMYSSSEGVVETVDGAVGGETIELTLPTWNEWYWVSGRLDSDNELVLSLWVRHQIK